MKKCKKHVFKLIIPFCFDVFSNKPNCFVKNIALKFNITILLFLLEFLIIEEVLPANHHCLYQLFN